MVEYVAEISLWQKCSEISLWKLNAAAKSCNTKITSHCLVSFAELTSPVQNNCLLQRMLASKNRNAKRTLSSIEFPISNLCFFSHLDPSRFSHVFSFSSIFSYISLFLFFFFIPPLHHFLPSFLRLLLPSFFCFARLKSERN